MFNNIKYKMIYFFYIFHMCYNLETSFGTFGIGAALIIALLLRGSSTDKWNAAFIIPVISMQLLEGFMWLDIDNKKGINNLMCKLVPLILALQPVGQILGCSFQNPELRNIAYVITLMSLFAAISTILEVKNAYATPGVNGHLQWPIVARYRWYIPLYFIGITMPLLLMKPGIQGILQFIGIFVGFAISLIRLPLSELHSKWCWDSIFYAGGAYFLPMLIDKIRV